MHYKLVAFDIDGTIRSMQDPVSDKNTSVINRLIDSGIIVTIATGRMFFSASLALEGLNIIHPIICFRFNITPMDKFHHYLFVFFGAIPMLLFWKGPFMQLTMFFTCGLPGAIDYFILCLVKHNYILKLEQNMKKIKRLIIL